MQKVNGNLVDLDEYDINEVLHGYSEAIFYAKLNREKYEKYKNGNLDNIEEYEKKGLEILSLLDNLGYPMGELGTYLYKDVIEETYNNIKDITKRTDMPKARKVISELEDAYSNLYRYVARECNEMGILPFHLCIERAIKMIDVNRIDSNLAVSVFGSNPEPMNYGLQAFQLASYVANKYSMKYETPKILNLSNLEKE